MYSPRARFAVTVPWENAFLCLEALQHELKAFSTTDGVNTAFVVDRADESRCCSMTIRRRGNYKGAYANGELMFAFGLAEGVPVGDVHVMKKHRQFDFTHGQLRLPCTFTVSMKRTDGAADILLILWDEHHKLFDMERFTVNVPRGSSLYPVLMPGPNVTVEMQ